MYKKMKATTTDLNVNKSTQGETMEQKVRRILNNKEPIKDVLPVIYTPRKDGVRPEMNIRTDRFEVATEAMDMVTKDKLAKREDRQKARDGDIGKAAKEGMKKEGEAAAGDATNN